MSAWSLASNAGERVREFGVKMPVIVHDDFRSFPDQRDLLSVSLGRTIGLHALQWEVDAREGYVGVHHIYISPYLSPDQANATLWHEVTHARDAEQFPPGGFEEAYRQEQASVGYGLNRFEQHARLTEAQTFIRPRLIDTPEKMKRRERNPHAQSIPVHGRRTDSGRGGAPRGGYVPRTRRAVLHQARRTP